MDNYKEYLKLTYKRNVSLSCKALKTIYLINKK